MAQQQLQHVPKAQVGEVVQSFITNDGATKVTATEEPGSNDTWTVIAFIP